MPMLLKIKKTGKGYGRAYRRHIPQDNYLCGSALLFGHTSTDYHARSDRQMVCHPACICRNTDCIYLFALLCLSQHKSSFLVHTQKYGYIILVLALLMLITELVTHFPLPENANSKLPLEFRRHLHSQTVWFSF